MDKKFFAEFLKALRMAYPHSFKVETNEERNLWYNHLKGYPKEHLFTAMIVVQRRIRAFPSIADFIEVIEEIGDWGVEAAWGEACVNIGAMMSPVYNPKTGQTEYPEFKDPIAKETLLTLGLDYFSLSQNSSILFAHFKRTYERIKNKKETGAVFEFAQGLAANNQLDFAKAFKMIGQPQTQQIEANHD